MLEVFSPSHTSLRRGEKNLQSKFTKFKTPPTTPATGSGCRPKGENGGLENETGGVEGREVVGECG